MRQQVSIVFSLHLVYLSTAACISEKNKIGSMLAQGFLRVKKSSKNHKMLLFVSWGNEFVIIEWPSFDAPSSTIAFLLPLVYLGAVAYISVGIS